MIEFSQIKFLKVVSDFIAHIFCLTQVCIIKIAFMGIFISLVTNFSLFFLK